MTPQELTQLLQAIPKDIKLQAVLVGHASGERYELPGAPLIEGASRFASKELQSGGTLEIKVKKGGQQ